MNSQKAFEKLLKEKWKIIKETNKETLDKFELELSISSVNKDINDTIKYINSKEKELKKEFRDSYGFEEKILGLIILEHTYIFSNLEKNFGIYQEENKLNKSDNPLKLAFVLFHQMNNSIVVYFKLIKDGFSFQANLIFRNIIEQGTTIFAILLDENFAKEFKANSEIINNADKIKHWSNKLSPKKINTILKKSYQDIEGLTSTQESFFDYKEHIYSSTSEFVHSQFLASFMSTYSSKKDDDYVDLNLYGRIDSNVDRLLFLSLPYFMSFVGYLITILIAKYDFRLAGSDKVEGLKIFALNSLTRKMIEEYFEKNTTAQQREVMHKKSQV